MPSWVLAVLRVLGIRSAADVVPVATTAVEAVRDVVDPPEPGQPLPYASVQNIQRQIESATSQKVPPKKPRTGNPARVVAASAPGRPAPFASPPEGGGAAGTQGESPRRCVDCGRELVRIDETFLGLQQLPRWGCPPCELAIHRYEHERPGVAKAVDRSIITPREGVRIAPPRPAPRKEPEK